MYDLTKEHPVKHSYWAETDELNLQQAAMLTFGIDPFTPDFFLDYYTERLTLADLPRNFSLRIEALRSSINAGMLNHTQINHDEDNNIDASSTRIKTDDFVAWCDRKKLPHNIPGRTTQPQTTKWPWGDYETDLLRKLADAAKQWWSTYDPDDPTTAPKNNDVIKWLTENGVSERVAGNMATILRADGLPTGPRKQSSAPRQSQL